MASNREDNIAKANAHYNDRQRRSIADRARIVEERNCRTDAEQLKRLDKAGLVAKKERAKLHKRIAENSAVQVKEPRAQKASKRGK